MTPIFVYQGCQSVDKEL